MKFRKESMELAFSDVDESTDKRLQELVML